MALAIIALAWPAWGTVEPGGDAASPPGAAVELRADGSLSLRVEQAVPLADLVREIGALIGAEVVVRRDPGTIDPTSIEALAPEDMLVRLAGRHSLALRFRSGGIVGIILIGSQESGPQRERPLVQNVLPPDALAGPHEPSSEQAAQERRAATIRDIVKLSYQDTTAAAAELEDLYFTSDDPAVRGAAIAALAGSGRRDAVTLINHALYDPEPQVRLHAAAGLRVARGVDAAPQLEMMAESDPAPEVRAGIARLLEGDGPVDPQTMGGPHPQAVDR